MMLERRRWSDILSKRPRFPKSTVEEAGKQLELPRVNPIVDERMINRYIGLQLERRKKRAHLRRLRWARQNTMKEIRAGRAIPEQHFEVAENILELLQSFGDDKDLQKIDKAILRSDAVSLQQALENLLKNDSADPACQELIQNILRSLPKNTIEWGNLIFLMGLDQEERTL